MESGRNRSKLDMSYSLCSKTGMRWNIKPMNMYLYDGLAGMLLLMYQLQQFDRQEEVKDVSVLKRCFLTTRTGGLVRLRT